MDAIQYFKYKKSYLFFSVCYVAPSKSIFNYNKHNYNKLDVYAKKHKVARLRNRLNASSVKHQK